MTRTKKTKDPMHELPPDHPLEILRLKQVEKIKAAYLKHGTRDTRKQKPKHIATTSSSLLVGSIEEVLKFVYGESPSSSVH